MFSCKNSAHIILLLLLFSISIEAQKGDGVYNYPLRPGMVEWKKLKTHGEMLQVLQLPSELLKSISTRSLIKTCLDYPLFSDIWAYDNIKDGFEQLRKDFNGFNELFSRKDVLKELIEFYVLLDPNKVSEKSSLLEKGLFTAEFCKIEIILFQPEIIKNSNKDIKRILLREIVNKHEKMLSHPEFDIRSIESNVFLMGNILILSDFSMKLKLNKNVKANNFLNTSKFIDEISIIEVVSLSKEYLNNH